MEGWLWIVVRSLGFPCRAHVRFEVELLGSQFLVERFDSSGTVINVSRGGMLAEVDRLLAVGTDCVVSLVRTERVQWPEAMRGRVRRSTMGRAGWEIGIEFDRLMQLETLAQLQAVNFEQQGHVQPA